MDKLRLSLLAMCMFAIAAQAKANSYDEVNNHLKKTVQDFDDVDSVYAAAEKYLGELNQERHLFGSRKVDLLNEIVALKDISTDCSMKSLEQFEQVVERWNMHMVATHYWINSVAAKHADHCLDEIVNLKNLQLAQLDPEQVALLKSYTDLLLPNMKKSFDYFKEGKLTHRTKTELLENDNGIDKVIRERLDKLGEVIDDKDRMETRSKYIIRPCKLYTIQLSDVFNQWAWASVRASSEVANQEKYDEMRQDFLRFEACKIVEGRGFV